MPQTIHHTPNTIPPDSVRRALRDQVREDGMPAVSSHRGPVHGLQPGGEGLPQRQHPREEVRKLSGSVWLCVIFYSFHGPAIEMAPI